jgi:hypothetical protein
MDSGRLPLPAYLAKLMLDHMAIFDKRDGTCDKPPVSHPAAPLLLPPGRNDLADQRPKQPFAPERKAA